MSEDESNKSLVLFYLLLFVFSHININTFRFMMAYCIICILLYIRDFHKRIVCYSCVQNYSLVLLSKLSRIIVYTMSGGIKTHTKCVVLLISVNHRKMIETKRNPLSQSPEPIPYYRL